MSDRHDLPRGGWVELVDLDDGVTERQRRPIVTALQALSKPARAYLADTSEGNSEVLTGRDMELLYEVNDRIAAGCIVKASFLADGERCTVDHVRDLKAADYDVMLQLAAPYLPMFMGVDFETRDPGRTNPISPSSE